MTIKSYAKWKDYEIRMPIYLDGHKNYNDYDVIKWEQCEPREVLDWSTGKKKIQTKCCFTIGTLHWDSKERWFKFESCGLRYLEHRKKGLEKFLLKFANKMQKNKSRK